MKKLPIIFIIFILLITSCTGAASRKAKKQYGVSPKEIEKCTTKQCFNNILIKYESEILKTGTNEDGTHYEIYKVRRERGSNTRSFVHAIISIGTLGIWNVVAYPIEGFVSDDKYLVFRVSYDKNGNATRVDIQGG